MNHSSHVRSFLAAVRRRWFAHEALSVLARAAGAAGVIGLLALSLYWFFAPGGVPLMLLAAAALAGALAAAGAIVWCMQRHPDDQHVARFVEERAARLPGRLHFEDALVTAVDPGAATDPAFGPLLAATAAERLRDFTPGDIVSAAALRRAALEASAGVVLLVGVLALAAGPLKLAAESARLTFFPETIQVEVVPGDARVVAGQPLKVRAILRSGTRALTDLIPDLVVSAGSGQRTVAMVRDSDGFVFPFESVDRTFKYRVIAGSARSHEHTVTALFAPRVERIDLHYRYPAFTGLRPRTEEDGGDIYAPAGTRVRVRVHTDKPVVSGRMSFEADGARTLAGGGGRVLETELVLDRDDAYRVELVDGDGLQGRGETEYFIRLMDDRPPDVRIVRPAGDQQITPLEEVAIEARAEDDHGISALELVYSVPGGPTRVVPLATRGDSETVRTGSHLLAAEDLRVKPGDVVSYYARARDVGRGKRPTEARSDMYFLEVRPFGEEFVAARSQAGGGASSAQIESLIAAQKEIISATWNIERRSSVGRSASDVEAVARAQAELKARVEQMGSRRRGRGRFDMPQQISPAQPRAPRQGSDPIADAVEAMGRAIEQLRGQRTKDALPHEMAALQRLLQAQAEIRRREVMQQQASGAASGGAGRSGEDLSALFDKELQRQQRTNYEMRSQLEERPDRADQDSALDRIRDLARRQEELSRRQRELADGTLDAEERKRQLERLTREQTELRQQVEDLAKQASDAGAQQREGSKQSSPPRAADSTTREGSQGAAGGRSDRDQAGRGRQLQEASEQMRDAAGDLGREDPKSAAERSARAAEQLRRLEEQLRSDSPEARRRAAGELQLEAQQIAEEQRRIASEAGRLDRGRGSASQDARRRLAGEKDQLADRTEALRRAASELAREGAAGGRGAGDPSERIGAAARELEKQQLDRRMRETAERMRQGMAGPAGGRETGAQTTPAGLAGPEEQIARALDRIVEQLGGGSAGERQLTSQLEQTRGIRDRLDRLERQIAEAEARQKEMSASGREGRAQGPPGSPLELDRLRQEYARELQQAREMLGRLQESAPRSGVAGTTPERHEWSQADPGTQGFKQDFSGWQALRKDIDLALERTEAAASARLARQAAQDRLSAGGSERVPDEYRRLIARYYEALARTRK